jgi:hypothetical protein
VEIKTTSPQNSPSARWQVGASATRLSSVLGTRGFPSHDYSWFGFIGNVGLNFSFILMSNFNAKRDFLLEPIDFQKLL